METLRISIHVRSEKRNELLRICHSVIDFALKESDCKKSIIKQHDDNENFFSLEQEWARWDAVKNYLQSDQFTALLGAMKFLSKSYRIHINDSSNINGMKPVETSRPNKT